MLHLSPKLCLLLRATGENEYLAVLLIICFSECRLHPPSGVTRLCDCQASAAPSVAAFGSRNSPFQLESISELTQDFIRDNNNTPDLFQ